MAVNARIGAFETRFNGHKHNYVFQAQNGGNQVIVIGKTYTANQSCSKPGPSINYVQGKPPF